jgi:hypothetical protein
MQLITLREAGKRLRPDKPLTPNRVRQLAREFSQAIHPFPDSGDGRVKSGITPQAVVVLKRKRAQ